MYRPLTSIFVDVFKKYVTSQKRFKDGTNFSKLAHAKIQEKPNLLVNSDLWSQSE
jgi:hypothetical protein